MIVRVVLNGNTNSDGSNFVRSLSAPTWDVPASYTWHRPHPKTGRLGHAGSASLVLDVDRPAIPCMAVRSVIEVSRAETGSFLGLQYVSLARRFARGACEMLCAAGRVPGNGAGMLYLGNSSAASRLHCGLHGKGALGGCAEWVCSVGRGYGTPESTWIWL